MSSSNATHALAAFVRLLLHARAGGQARVDALLALSQRTLLVPLRLDNSDGYATLVNENGDWALPVFTSQDQLEAAADVFGWRRADRVVLAEEVGARRAVHYALNEGAAYIVIDAVAPHALEAARSELKPLVSTQNRSDRFGPYAGAGRISSSILAATQPDGASLSESGIAPPRITRPPTESSSSPPEPGARVTRASFAPPSDDGAPAQRRPTVSFTRSSQPPPAVEVQLERASWAPEGPVGSTVPSPPPTTGITQRPPPDYGAYLEEFGDDLYLGDERDTPESLPSWVRTRPPEEPTAVGNFYLDTERPRRTSAPAAGLLDLDAPQDPTGTEEQGLSAAGTSSAPPISKPPGFSSVPSGNSSSPLPPPEEPPRQLLPYSEPPNDALLAALAELLRDYPEVEWATYGLAVNAAGAAEPAICLRVLDSFRKNIGAILALCIAAAEDHRAYSMRVLLLDDPELIASARAVGEVFYPWRQKSRT